MMGTTLICFLLVFVGLRAQEYEDNPDIGEQPNVDCVVGKWICGNCNKLEGSKSCYRRVKIKAQMNGIPCPDLTKKVSCDVDCEMTNWGDWKPCPRLCGGSKTSRRREVKVRAKNNGKSCGLTYQQKPCNTQPCPIPCKQTEFQCKACNKKTGYMTCTRTTTRPAKFGGRPCGELMEKRRCRVDCEMTPFGQYGLCSKECGGGVAFKTRKILYRPKNGGDICGAEKYEKSCNDFPCSADCKQSAWRCHACDPYTGKSLCTRDIIQNPVYKGLPCGDCLKVKPCKVDCAVDYWRSWTHCSKECGQGEQTRYREIIHKEQNGGRPCPNLKQSRSCFLRECPVHCKVSAWTCGTCDLTTGLERCHRKVVIQPNHHGRKCPTLEKYRHCKVDCKVKEYSRWSYCTKKCGRGYQWRLRGIQYYPRHGGKLCPGLKERRSCNTQPCKQDCEQSEWICEDCNPYKGERRCTRKIITQPEHGGKLCGLNEKWKKCRVDCRVSKWSSFGRCSRKCGGGTKVRTRTMIWGAQYGGLQCPDMEHTVSCNLRKCTRNCKQTAWDCSAACNKNTGTRKCTRQTLHGATGYGRACGPTTKEEYCKVDCEMGAWGAFGKCSEPCGKGLMKRTRSIIVDAKHGGKLCGITTDERICNAQVCDTDCVEKVTCSNCNPFTGKQQCRSKIESEPKGNGKRCKYPDMYSFTKDCVVNCKWTKWGMYSPCSKTCGGGTKTRTRRVDYPAKNGGKPCLGKTKEDAACFVKECVGTQCNCPKVVCKYDEEEKMTGGTPSCPCPKCEKKKKYMSGASVAGFAVGGLAFIFYGIMKFQKRKDQDHEYTTLLNSSETQIL